MQTILQDNASVNTAADMQLVLRSDVQRGSNTQHNVQLALQSTAQLLGNQTQSNTLFICGSTSMDTSTIKLGLPIMLRDQND